LKILQINNFGKKFGGAESVFFNTIDLLTKKNHEVISFSLSNENNEFSKDLAYYVNKKSKLHNKLYSIEAKNRIELLVQKEKPDIAHIHNIVGGVTFSILPTLRKYKVPTVITLHDFRLFCPVYVFLDKNDNVCEKCRNGNYLNCFINKCSKQGYFRSFFLASESYFRDYFIPYSKFIDSFIAVSNFVKTKISEARPELEKKTTMIYHFSNNFSQNSYMGKYFLYFGRLSPEKGLFTLVSAFRTLLHHKLLIVGEGPIKNDILKNKPPNVELLGYKEGEELRMLIQNAFFVLNTSECYETNSMVIVESYSYGKPIIGAKIGAIPELVIENKTGFLFESKNVQSLIQVISHSTTISKAEYENMSNNAFKFAKEKFSSERHYEVLYGVYENLISSKKYQRKV
jgi:glycosyltransferase involved in cell wall biosynthesis